MIIVRSMVQSSDLIANIGWKSARLTERRNQRVISNVRKPSEHRVILCIPNAGAMRVVTLDKHTSNACSNPMPAVSFLRVRFYVSSHFDPVA
jgi:hypothetical protein